MSRYPASWSICCCTGFTPIDRVHAGKQHSRISAHPLQRQPADEHEYEAEQAQTRIGEHRQLRYRRSEEHTSELQSLMRISYAVFCLKQKTTNKPTHPLTPTTSQPNNNTRTNH